jgi:nitroreductase
MSMSPQEPAAQPTGAPFDAVAEAIRSRRTIKQFLPQRVPRELLQQLFDLAIWAPNHRLTEPWRFYVLDGASRTQLGAIAQHLTYNKLVSSGVEVDAALRKASEAASAWSSVPTLVYVTSQLNANPEIELENYGAVCCAIHNFCLAAHAAGIGTSWSSGAVAAAPALHVLAGATPDERMVGLLRAGYLDPATQPARSRRAPGSSCTKWLDEAH